MIYCCIPVDSLDFSKDYVKELERDRFLYQSNQECIDNRYVDTLKVVNAKDILTPEEIKYYDYSINSLVANGIPVGNVPVSYQPTLDDVINQVEKVDGLLQAFIESQNVISNERVEAQA